jgi:hypothetical protein
MVVVGVRPVVREVMEATVVITVVAGEILLDQTQVVMLMVAA